MTSRLLLLAGGMALITSLFFGLTSSGTGSVLPAHLTASTMLALPSTRAVGLAIYAAGASGLLAVLASAMRFRAGTHIATAAVLGGIAAASLSLHMLAALSPGALGLGGALATVVPAVLLIP